MLLGVFLMIRAFSNNVLTPFSFSSLDIALCFMLCGFSLLLSSRNKLGALITSSLVIIVSISTILNTDTKILYLTDALGAERMTSYVAYCFLLVTIGIWMFSKKTVFFLIGTFIGTLVFGIGTSNLAGHLIKYKASLFWLPYTEINAYTSVGFMLLGVGIIASRFQEIHNDFSLFPKTRRETLFMGYTLLISIPILMLEISIPPNISTSLMYVNLVLLGWLMDQKRTLLWMAMVASALVFLGYLFRPVQLNSIAVMANASIVIAILWITATLLYNIKRRDQQLQKTNLLLNKKTHTKETELRLTEKIYQEQTSILEEMLERTMVGYWDWMIKENKEYRSPTFKKMFGYKNHEISDAPEWWKEHIHPEDLPKLTEVYDKHVASKGKFPCEQEVRYRHKDGHTVWVYSRAKVIEWDNQGNPVRMVGNHVDISGLKEAEQEVIKNEEKFRKIFEEAGIGIVLIDSEGKPTLANRSFEEMVEWQHHEIVKTTFSHFIHPEEVTNNSRLFLQLINGEIDFYTTEQRLITKTGKTIWVILTVTLNQNALEATNKSSAIAMIQNINSKKTSEQRLQQTNKEMEQFAYVASHDLQEPLRVITSYLQLLEKKIGTAIDQKTEEYITRAINASNRMKILIDDLLTFSRAGSEARNFIKIDPTRIIEEVKDDLEVRIEESKAEIVFNTFPAINGDPSQIKQLLQNLIDNALKFKKTEVHPIVKITAKQQGGMVDFSVEDNGIGIDEEYHERIFTIFQRLHTRDKYKGTGIGLALCKKIVEQHGGRIHLKSKYGEGSVFYFSLPFYGN